MTKLLIKQGRVIDPASKLDKVCDVLIEDGVISIVGTVTPYQARNATRINAKGKIVAPGLIDVHVHCREPGQEGKETIATASAAAVAVLAWFGATSRFLPPSTLHWMPMGYAIFALCGVRWAATLLRPAST